MGQFSWIIQDTDEAVREKFGCDDIELTTAYMHDNKGRVWKEECYEGYGVFGGKDFYQLLAEMNNVKGLNGDVDHDRSIGIDLCYGDEPCLSPNITRYDNWEWINKAPESDPDQGWGTDEEFFDECYY